jgi:Tol biopolymer transport system component
VVFSDTLVHRVIERASLEHLDDPPLALYTDGAPFTARASQTTDGRVIAFERVSGAGYEIRHKDLTTGVERTIATTVSDQQVNPTIAPNGSRISYVVRNAAGFDRGQTYVVETAGGIPKMICDTCGLSHFLDDSRRLVIVPAGATDVRVVDVESMVAYDVLHAPSGGLSRPTVSPNERWLAFRRAEGVTGKTFVTRFVGRSESPPPPEAWSPIDEPTTTGRPAGWSPDSRVLYLLLDVDGYRCLWAQRVDESGRLLGKPYPARHFHDERGNTMGTTLGNAISPLGFLYERATVTGSLWRLTPPSEARSASR